MCCCAGLLHAELTVNPILIFKGTTTSWENTDSGYYREQSGSVTAGRTILTGVLADLPIAKSSRV